MQTRSSDENSVRPSVRLSVIRVNCDKMAEKSVQIYIPYDTKDHLAWFLIRRMVGGGDPFYLKFWVNRPRWSEIADFQPIFARNSSAVTPSEKSSIDTNRKSTTRFPMSLR